MKEGGGCEEGVESVSIISPIFRRDSKVPF